MPQEKYHRLSHFVPDGHPKIYPGMTDEVKQMMPYLIENTSRRWTKVPGHDIEVFATRNKEVPLLGFRKKGKEVYLHVCCNEFINPFYAVEIVAHLYIEYDFGQPTFLPEELNWIHTIPLPGADLSHAEVMLIHQITQSLFWTIYMDYKRSKST